MKNKMKMKVEIRLTECFQVLVRQSWLDEAKQHNQLKRVGG